MSNIDERVAVLYTELEKHEDVSWKLDDLVHEAASRIGSAVNNGGLESQIEFLLEQGYVEDDIRKELA